MGDKIDEALGLGPDERAVPSPHVQIMGPRDHQQMSQVDQEDDYEFARRNIRDLIITGKESLSEIQEVAVSSESPRAYEVVATMIDKLVAANEKLIVVSEKKRDSLAKAPGTDKVINQTQNIVMVGSTDDLLKMAKKARGDTDEEELR